MSFQSSIELISSSLFDVLGIPSTRVAADCTTLAWYLLPPAVLYGIMAVLAITPQTRGLQIALWPILALLALRASLSVDMSFGRRDLKIQNGNLSGMINLVARPLEWILTKERLVRVRRPANSPPSALMDAFDLVSNVRGLGWNLPQGIYVPPQTRPTNSRVTFASLALFSAIVHAWIARALQRAILEFAPMGAGPTVYGSTIFDDTLPMSVRYLRSSLIAFLAGLTVYCVIQIGYEVYTVVSVLVMRRDPTELPPIFDSPWLATSLNDFWGRRWHQMARPMLLFIGGHPLSLVLGRTGIILGAFLASGIYHHLALLVVDDQAELRWMLIGFGMMGPGLLIERAFYRMTKKKVGGPLGWIWTMSWLMLWGAMIVEGFARGGLFNSITVLDEILPVRAPVEPFVRDFDRWLHTFSL